MFYFHMQFLNVCTDEASVLGCRCYMVSLRGTLAVPLISSDFRKIIESAWPVSSAVVIEENTSAGLL